jgi:cold shock CspA family protein
MVGRVTHWSKAGGYGFVTVAGGTQYFLHCTNFAKGNDHPDIGQWVVFALGKALAEGKPDQCVSVRYASPEEIGLSAVPAAAVTALKGGTQ